MKFKTIIGSVQLTPLRKLHIIEKHPIMEDYLDKLNQILEKPKEIRLSNYSDDVLLFYRYFAKIEGGKYVVGVVNKFAKEVKTASLTHRIKSGRKYAKKE